MRKNKAIKQQLIKKTTLSIIFLGIGFLLLFLANSYQGFADWYAVNVYALLTGTLGRVLGIIPFSVAEIMLYLLLFALIANLIYVLAGLIRRKSGGTRLLQFLSRIMVTASVLFCLYIMCCGVNYRRISFAGHAGIEESNYTVDELSELCLILTQDVNRLSQQLVRDNNGTMVLLGNEQQEAAAAMAKLGQEFEALSGTYPQPKKLVNPWILSIQKLSGIYSPFTMEANYNGAMTDYNIPFTACHELAHLKGFMEEEEANFIAYLACSGSDNEMFQYSGALTAWIYNTNALRKADKEVYREVCAKLCDEAKADLKENNTYWKQFEGKVAEVANRVNDHYLKVNGQAEGVVSYGRMVDLMIAFGKRQV